MNLLTDYSDELREGRRIIQLNFAGLPKDCGLVSLRMHRPTKDNGLIWDKSGIIKITHGVVVDGVETPICVGQASGGLRPDDASEYGLLFSMQYSLGKAGREYLDTAQKDALGIYRNVPLSWLYQDAEELKYFLILEQMGGDTIPVEIITLDVLQFPAPVVDTKNSVAFDSSTGALEVTGDGVLSLSHTCGGSNRALFASVGAATIGPGTSTSMTFASTGMTEQWDHDIASGTATPHAGYTLLNPSGGLSETLTSTLSNNETNRHLIGCTALTGVASVGNVQTSVSAASPTTVTPTGVGADDMVVDSVYGQVNDPSVGADQTQRVSQNSGSDFLEQSTQPGSAGGAMSWTSTFVDFWGHGAVNFVASGAAPAAPKTFALLGVGT